MLETCKDCEFLGRIYTCTLHNTSYPICYSNDHIRKNKIKGDILMDKIKKKLEELILKTLGPDKHSIERARELIRMRVDLAHIKNMEKR